MDRKNGVDLFRLIGAFFILTLHASYGEENQEFSNYLRLFGRWAVPFYFIASGFFLGRKIDGNFLEFKKIQNNVVTLISILLVSSVIYLPIVFLKGGFYPTIGNLFTGTHFHLWFIGSLLFGTIFIWYLYMIKKSNLLPYFAIFVLILALFADSYDQFLGLNVEFSLFRFLISIPFLSIGIYLSKNHILKQKKNLLGLVILGLGLQLVEVKYFDILFNYDRGSHQLLIGTVITAISIFIYSSTLSLKENKLSKWGKEHSLFIYLYHPITYIFVVFLINKLNFTGFVWIKLFLPVFGFFITLAGAIFLNNYMPKIYGILNGRNQIP